MQLITALDFDNFNSVKKLVESLDDSVGYYKVGLELFVSCGQESVEYLKHKGKKVFLDLKFHDIPNTASKAVASAVSMGVDMVNIHTQGGLDMMTACVGVVNDYASKSGSRPMLIGVTLLTSLDSAHLGLFGLSEKDPAAYVLKLASLAKKSGLDGVVSSANETRLIKDNLGDSFITVTPGIRPIGGDLNDQKRVVTPFDAKLLGTDYIVVGRPITAAKDPQKAVCDILKEIGQR